MQSVLASAARCRAHFYSLFMLHHKTLSNSYQSSWLLQILTISSSSLLTFVDNQQWIGRIMIGFFFHVLSFEVRLGPVLEISSPVWSFLNPKCNALTSKFRICNQSKGKSGKLNVVWQSSSSLCENWVWAYKGNVSFSSTLQLGEDFMK